jgi:hypothetical protein
MWAASCWDVDERRGERVSGSDADLWASLDAVEWADLACACGSAADVPGLLRAIVDADKAPKAISGLWELLATHGHVFDATAIAIPFLVELLAKDQARPVRVELLKLVGRIGSAGPYDDSYWNWWLPEDQEDPEWKAELERQRRASEACRHQAVKALMHVIACTDDIDPEVRSAALATMSILASSQEALTLDVERARNTALERVRLEPAPDTRAAAVLALAITGGDVRPLLADGDPRSRLAAALAPSLRADPAADAILLDALSRPHELDALFPRGLPYPGWERVRIVVTQAVCDRIADRDVAIGPLLEIMRDASPYSWFIDREIILPYLFDPPHAGGRLTGPQRAFLEALVDRPDLWEPRDGTAALAFKKAGLPHSRRAVAELLRT